MAWYERYANQKNVAPGLNSTNYIQNGSWVVDHFSAAGSRKMTDFFDQHVVSDDQSRQLLAAVGGNGTCSMLILLSHSLKDNRLGG